ncbi:MAG: hypothetical protein KH138_00320 [Firmicutes bacterium]|nr:hypothetical protein [Bacillota bacterium]
MLPVRTGRHTRLPCRIGYGKRRRRRRPLACPAQEHRDRRRSFLAPRTGPGGDGPAARRII